jgi:hypothetical protein
MQLSTAADNVQCPHQPSSFSTIGNVGKQCRRGSLMGIVFDFTKRRRYLLASWQVDGAFACRDLHTNVVVQVTGLTVPPTWASNSGSISRPTSCRPDPSRPLSDCLTKIDYVSHEDGRHTNPALHFSCRSSQAKDSSHGSFEVDVEYFWSEMHLLCL